MDRLVTTIGKRLLLLFACSVAIVVFLAQGFSHGVFSSQAFRIALLIIGIGMSVAAIIIVARAARELEVPPSPPGDAPIDESTRKRRLLCIRAAKCMIAALFVSLFLGLLRGGPWLPVAVGTIMAGGLIASLMWWIMQLRKSLKNG